MMATAGPMKRTRKDNADSQSGELCQVSAGGTRDAHPLSDLVKIIRADMPRARRYAAVQAFVTVLVHTSGWVNQK